MPGAQASWYTVDELAEWDAAHRLGYLIGTLDSFIDAIKPLNGKLADRLTKCVNDLELSQFSPIYEAYIARYPHKRKYAASSIWIEAITTAC